MIELSYDGSVEGLFAILAGVCGGAPLPDRIRRRPAPFPGRREPELFDPDAPDRGSAPGLSPGKFPGSEELFSLSVGAFDDFLSAWMSEFPLEREIIRFGRKVIFAARAAGAKVPGGVKAAEARLAAEKARTDRGDGDVRAVLEAAYKVRHETHRLMGFLRFRPDSRGGWTARCAPDHFVLPALAAHFSRRFGDAPWLIIDEKRGLCLRGGLGEPRLEDLPVLPRETPPPDTGEAREDPWEALWRTYHGAVTIPDRKNPGLQRQCIPLRYWKYLSEMKGPPAG